MYKEALEAFNELKGTVSEEELTVISMEILNELSLEKEAGIISTLAEDVAPKLLGGVASLGDSLGAAGTGAALSNNKVISGIGNKAMNVGASIKGNPAGALKSVGKGVGIFGAGMAANKGLSNANKNNGQFNPNNPQ